MIPEQKLTRIVWTREIIFIIIGNFLLHVHLETLWVHFLDWFKDIVDLLKLSTIWTEHFVTAEMTIHIDQVCLEDFDFLTFVNDALVYLIFKPFKCLILGFFLSCKPPLFFPDNSLFCFLFLVFFCLFNSIILSFDSLLMLILCVFNTFNDYSFGSLDNFCVFINEVANLIHQPWYNLLMHRSASWWNQYALGAELTHGIFSKSRHPLLSKHTSINLFMCRFLLLLPCLILQLSSLSFFLASQLSCLVPLCHYKLSVDNFLVFFLLTLYYCLFGFFQNFHPCLLECFLAENVEHWFNFLIEIEKLFVTLVYLGCLAVLFLRHLGLEQGYWRPIKVKLSCNSFLSFLGLVC